MKILSLLMVLLTGTISLAESVTITDEKALAPYKEATANAIYKAGKADCTYGSSRHDGFDIPSFVWGAKKLVVSDGEQPLLIFSHTKAEKDSSFIRHHSDAVAYRLTVTTTADFQQVVGTQIEVDKKFRRNIGNLQKPLFVDVIENDPSLTCKN